MIRTEMKGGGWREGGESGGERARVMPGSQATRDPQDVGEDVWIIPSNKGH